LQLLHPHKRTLISKRWIKILIKLFLLSYLVKGARQKIKESEEKVHAEPKNYLSLKKPKSNFTQYRQLDVKPNLTLGNIQMHQWREPVIVA